MVTVLDPPRTTHPCTVSVRCHDDGVPVVRFEVGAGQRVLHEMIRCNVRALPVGCRGGGCGVCRVRVVEGAYLALRMSRKHVSGDDVERGVVLACRIVPVTDLVLELAPIAPVAAHNPCTEYPSTDTDQSKEY